ncbi:MAG: hypothetical protein V7703_14950, partial [Hyphomicrobiales bacterium]
GPNTHKTHQPDGVIMKQKSKPDTSGTSPRKTTLGCSRKNSSPKKHQTRHPWTCSEGPFAQTNALDFNQLCAHYAHFLAGMIEGTLSAAMRCRTKF